MNFYYKAMDAFLGERKEEAIELFKLSIDNYEKNWESYVKLYELDESKNINFLYKSIESMPNKWAYLHLLYFYHSNNDLNLLYKTIDDFINFYDNKKIEIPNEDLESISYYVKNSPDEIKYKNIKKAIKELENRKRKKIIEKYISSNEDLISLDVNLKSNNKIILFTQFFDAPPEVCVNNIYCLYKNLSNPFIDEVILFVEKKANFENIFSSKLSTFKIDDRLSYEYWYENSLEKYPNDIKVLSNSDIFFDETISILKNINNWKDDIMFCCSRKDLSKNGELIESRILSDDCSDFIMPNLSQDCWIFKNKIKKFEKNYKLGYFHCDSKLRSSAELQDIKFVNLFNHINCIHLDWRKHKDRVSYSL